MAVPVSSLPSLYNDGVGVVGHIRQRELDDSMLIKSSPDGIVQICWVERITIQTFPEAPAETGERPTTAIVGGTGPEHGVQLTPSRALFINIAYLKMGP